MSVIDTDARTVVATISLVGFPSGIAIHPQGAFAYVTGAPEHGVSVIDTATNTVTATIEIGGIPNGIAMTADGRRAYITEFSYGNVFVIDTRTHRIRTFIPIGGVGAIPERLTIALLPEGCPVPPVPRLTSALAIADDVMRIDRPDALPVAGTVRIDSELLTYRSTQLKVLREVGHGAGGTQPSAHAVGSFLYLVGERGDANCDGRNTAADLTALVGQTVTADPEPCGGDLNGDGLVNLGDVDIAPHTVFPETRRPAAAYGEVWSPPAHSREVPRS